MINFYLNKRATWEFMRLFGYTRDTTLMTGFYVKKFSKRGQSQIYIDLIGILTERNKIVWNDDTKNEPIWPHIQDLLNYGLVDIKPSEKTMDFVEYLRIREFNYKAMDFYILSEKKNYFKVDAKFFSDNNISNYKIIKTIYEPQNPKGFDMGLTKIYLEKK